MTSILRWRAEQEISAHDATINVGGLRGLLRPASHVKVIPRVAGQTHFQFADKKITVFSFTSTVIALYV